MGSQANITKNILEIRLTKSTKKTLFAFTFGDLFLTLFLK